MEKGEGPVLLKKFGITAFPSLIIADADGGIVTYTVGFISPEQLIDLGKHGLLLAKK